MANKYAPVIPPQRSFADSLSARNQSLVKWECDRCKSAGAVPRLFDQNDRPIAARIRVAHERKTACHGDHKMRHVWVWFRGKRLSFDTYELTSANTNPKPGASDAPEADARG